MEIKNQENKKKAVAIRYDEKTDEVPRMVAKGEGEIADKIIALAKENGINVLKDTSLTELLIKLDLNSIIPFEAYLAVAEILSYIYGKNKNE